MPATVMNVMCPLQSFTILGELQNLQALMIWGSTQKSIIDMVLTLERNTYDTLPFDLNDDDLFPEIEPDFNLSEQSTSSLWMPQSKHAQRIHVSMLSASAV